MNTDILGTPRIVVGVALNLLIAGLGHVALGFWRRGLAWFALGLVLGLAFSYFIPEVASRGRITLFGITYGLLAALDAWRMAKLHNIAARERIENPEVEM